MSIFHVRARTADGLRAPCGPQALYGPRAPDGPQAPHQPQALPGLRAPVALWRSDQFRVSDDPRVFNRSRNLLALLVLGLLCMPALAQAEAASAEPRIDLNRATAEQLVALPGIGAAKAAAIVEYRASSGAFASVEDLEAVRGIGPALVAKLRPLVTLGSGSGPGGQARTATEGKPKARK